MVTVNWYLILTVLILYRYPVAVADSIRGCGGFVEASSALIRSRKPTDARLDFSHVVVELRTVDGLVKDWTQCAPNGYYFIPVYDKGLFVLKVRGPEGWTCYPEKVPVLVDDTGCNANEDINFQFTGFSLYGRVVGAMSGVSCQNKDSGPAGVNVELISFSGDVVSSASTMSSGSYSFGNIIPGKYKLRASHQDFSIEINGSDVVELGFNNVMVNDIFFVSGYNIHGYVFSQGNPVLGVHFFLYSDDVLELNCAKDFSSAPMLRKALCHAVSNADGMFKFTEIPCGTYEIIPFYKGEDTIFDVSPPSMVVSVLYDHVLVPGKFQVTGFSIGGRVVDHNGVGVNAAKVMVDGIERSLTDKEGYYKLDQVTSKRYSIEARKDHYKFERLDHFLVLPNMASVDDIKALAYELCGTVHIVTSNCKAKVALTRGPENVQRLVEQTDDRGNFCFEVSPGEYRLFAFAATPEIAPELLFSPPYIDITVDRPLLNFTFSQAQVNVNGSVLCLDKCPSSISLTLTSLGSKDEDGRTISLGDGGSHFSFSNVLPGNYRLEIRNYSPGLTSGEDPWCWKQNFLNFRVGVDDLEELIFIQKGFWVNIASSDEVDAYLMQGGRSQMNFTIKKGFQRICVQSPGLHELHFINPCVWFGSSSVILDTSSSSPNNLNLKGEKYLLPGKIHVDSNDNFPEHITVDILDEQGNAVGVTMAGLVSAESDQSGGAVYEYSFWAGIGENIIFFPRDARSKVDKKILFYPRKHRVTVAHFGCQDPVAPFSGRLGIYIEGLVSPPTSDVHIRVLADGPSEISQLKQGDTALETATLEDGLFLAGPLYDDISYRIVATKAGYSIKQVGHYSFSCQKLGRISVKLAFTTSDERFPSILLSLSGEDGYRNNSVTDVGGFFLFDNLSPGNFYLRPLLKEYAFSPPAEAISLDSGESKEVVFYATRVAFSALGKVTSLSGQPIEGVSVEARAESKGLYEETMTDVYGNYRLRGLYPETSYIIKVARKSDLTKLLERASPEFLSVQIGHEDIKQQDFVVFEQPDSTILTGHVERKTTMRFHSQMNVEIRSSTEPSKIHSFFPLPDSKFFQVNYLPKGKYLVQLRLASGPGAKKINSEIVEVDLETQTRVHIGPLTCKVEDSHKQELTPATAHPFIVGFSVIVLFICVPRFQELYKAASEMSISTAKKDVKKLIVKKKVR